MRSLSRAVVKCVRCHAHICSPPKASALGRSQEESGSPGEDFGDQVAGIFELYLQWWWSFYCPLTPLQHTSKLGLSFSCILGSRTSFEGLCQGFSCATSSRGRAKPWRRIHWTGVTSESWLCGTLGPAALLSSRPGWARCARSHPALEPFPSWPNPRDLFEARLGGAGQALAAVGVCVHYLPSCC